MGNVDVKCGRCQKIMAISPQNLGKQVRCPYCQQVVATPKSAPAAAVPASAGGAGGAAARPTPPGPSPSAEADQLAPTVAIETQPIVPKKSVLDDQDSIFGEVAESDDLFGRLPPKPKLDLPPPAATAPAAPPAPPAAAVTAPAAAPASPPSERSAAERRALIAAYLLIILIPYAIFITIVAVWFWMLSQLQGHPYDHLPATSHQPALERVSRGA